MGRCNRVSRSAGAGFGVLAALSTCAPLQSDKPLAPFTMWIEPPRPAGFSWPAPLILPSAPTPKKGALVTDLAFRPDGVIAVVVAEPGTAREAFVSRSAGKTWEPAAIPADGLSRIGAWISAGSSHCPLVLASDGRQWRDGADNDLGLRDWESSALFVSQTVRAHPRRAQITPTDPAAPPPAQRTPRPIDAPSCDEATSPYDLEAAAPHTPCIAGALGCIHQSVGPAARPGTRRIEFLGDAACALSDADRVWPSRCLPHAALVHPPTAVVADADDGTFRPIALLSACVRDPSAVLLPAGGATLLVCSGAADRQLFMGAADGVWRAEARVTLTQGGLGIGMSDDGTLVLRGACLRPRSCQGPGGCCAVLPRWGRPAHGSRSRSSAPSPTARWMEAGRSPSPSRLKPPTPFFSALSGPTTTPTFSPVSKQAAHFATCTSTATRSWSTACVPGGRRTRCWWSRGAERSSRGRSPSGALAQEHRTERRESE